MNPPDGPAAAKAATGPNKARPDTQGAQAGAQASSERGPRLTPAEVARATLKSLAERRLVPTPESFSETYHAVIGVRGGTQATAALVMRELLRELLRQGRMTASEVQGATQSAQRDDWNAVRDLVDRALGRAGMQAATPAKLASDTGLPSSADAKAAPETGTQIATDAKVAAGLQRLLALLCDNISTLAPNEAWLSGQLAPVRTLLSGPMQLARLSAAETQLATLAGRQADAREDLQQAKAALRALVGTLAQRASAAGDSAGTLVARIGDWQSALEQVDDLAGLSRVMDGLRMDAGNAREHLRHAHEELDAARCQIERYEQRVQVLERELVEVGELVQRDPLTHALNRRGLQEAFKVESARARRHGSALSLLLLDVDDFKRFNDTHGHVSGDRALTHAVTVMQAVSRATDVLARTGGEEFVLLLPATNLKQAQVMADRLVTSLAGWQFAGAHAYQPSLRITVSGGLATYRSDESLETLLARADAALYAAKRAGKNQVLATTD